MSSGKALSVTLTSPASCRAWSASYWAARSTQQAKTPGEADRVVISTIHRAKGLEWHTVVVCADAEELPHPRSSDLDEERRLAYVAVTRAAAQLVIAPAENGITSLLDDAIGGEL